MNYEALVDEIVERLKSHVITPTSSHFDVRPMPDSQKDFAAVTTKTRITVAYVGSAYDKPSGTASGAVHQHEHVTLALYVEGRKLRGVGGVYDAIGQVKAGLLGYKPTHGRTRLYVSGYGDWTFENNVIGPFLEMTFTGIASQTLNDQPAALGGPLTSTTITSAP
jgi:hypothetical protein